MTVRITQSPTSQDVLEAAVGRAAADVRRLMIACAQPCSHSETDEDRRRLQGRRSAAQHALDQAISNLLPTLDEASWITQVLLAQRAERSYDLARAYGIAEVTS